MQNKETPINPAAYIICVQVIGGKITISQPNFGFFDGKVDFESVKTLHEIGEMVGQMMLKVKKEVAKRTVLGMPIPPPTLPKEGFDIPERQWVTLPEAAKYLRVSESTMRRLFVSNVIPHRRTHPGNRYRVLRGHLDTYIRNGVPLFTEEPQRMQFHDHPTSENDGGVSSLADFLISPEAFFDQGSNC